MPRTGATDPAAEPAPRVVCRPGTDRPVQDAAPGVVLRPGLAFGAHYDPQRTSFGALVAHNVDVLAPGAAYGAHDHRDIEILTWVLAGTLVHVGPDGTEDIVAAGSLQYLATGTGWHHDERGGDEGAHLVQMWLAPALEDPPPGPPIRRVVTPGPADGLLAGPGAGVELIRSGVSVVRERLGRGSRRTLADARWRHVFVLRGAVTVDEPAPTDPAGPGDTVEVSGSGTCTLRAGDDGAEVLVVGTG